MAEDKDIPELKVVQFKRQTEGLSGNDVLEAAKDQYDEFVIIGLDHNGQLQAHSSHVEQTAERSLWFTSLFNHKLLNGDYF